MIQLHSMRTLQLLRLHHAPERGHWPQKVIALYPRSFPRGQASAEDRNLIAGESYLRYAMKTNIAIRGFNDLEMRNMRMCQFLNQDCEIGAQDQPVVELMEIIMFVPFPKGGH